MEKRSSLKFEAETTSYIVLPFSLMRSHKIGTKNGTNSAHENAEDQMFDFETKRNKQCYYGWLYLSTDSSKLMTIRDWAALLNPSPRRVNTPAPLSSHHSSPQSLYSEVSLNLFALVPRASFFPAFSIR